MHLQISRAPQHKEHLRYTELSPALSRIFGGDDARLASKMVTDVVMSVIICSYSFTLIVLGNQEVLMARKEPHFRPGKTSLHV